MIGRKDKGDTVVAHEFDYSIEKQVGHLQFECMTHWATRTCQHCSILYAPCHAKATVQEFDLGMFSWACFLGKLEASCEHRCKCMMSSTHTQLIYSRNGVNITATPVEHYTTGGPSALRVDWSGLSFVYSGAAHASRMGRFSRISTAVCLKVLTISIAW
jgi:hypothetical protein